MLNAWVRELGLLGSPKETYIVQNYPERTRLIFAQETVDSLLGPARGKPAGKKEEPAAAARTGAEAAIAGSAPQNSAQMHFAMESLGSAFLLPLTNGGAEIVAGATALYGAWLSHGAPVDDMDEGWLQRTVFCHLSLLFEEGRCTERHAASAHGRLASMLKGDGSADHVSEPLLAQHTLLCRAALGMTADFARERGHLMSAATWIALLRLLVGIADNLLSPSPGSALSRPPDDHLSAAQAALSRELPGAALSNAQRAAAARVASVKAKDDAQAPAEGDLAAAPPGATRSLGDRLCEDLVRLVFELFLRGLPLLDGAQGDAAAAQDAFSVLGGSLEVPSAAAAAAALPEPLRLLSDAIARALHLREAGAATSSSPAAEEAWELLEAFAFRWAHRRAVVDAWASLSRALTAALLRYVAGALAEAEAAAAPAQRAPSDLIDDLFAALPLEDAPPTPPLSPTPSQARAMAAAGAKRTPPRAASPSRAPLGDVADSASDVSLPDAPPGASAPREPPAAMENPMLKAAARPPSPARSPSPSARDRSSADADSDPFRVAPTDAPRRTVLLEVRWEEEGEEAAGKALPLGGGSLVLQEDLPAAHRGRGAPRGAPEPPPAAEEAAALSWSDVALHSARIAAADPAAPLRGRIAAVRSAPRRFALQLSPAQLRFAWAKVLRCMGSPARLRHVRGGNRPVSGEVHGTWGGVGGGGGAWRGGPRRRADAASIDLPALPLCTHLAGVLSPFLRTN